MTEASPTKTSNEPGGLTRLLTKAPSWVFVLFAVAASFSTYFCMYAFRKPFTAAKYEGLLFLDALGNGV
ncbi:MAG: hypothetical protein ACO3PR_07410, partial [Limisphaerales bacterium]